METTIITKGKMSFGFITSMPFICAQGETEDIVKEKINRYYKIWERKKK